MESDNYALVCLAPAGCSANLYQIFKKHAASRCQVIALDYPGHGRKLKQPLSLDIQHISQQLAQEIAALPQQQIVLFGHSLGAALLLPLVAALKAQNTVSKIKLLVLSSRPAPQYSQHLTQKHSLSEQALIAQLHDYAYLPKALFNNPELMHFCLKLIRHDFALSDALIASSQDLSTDLPMLVVAGDHDPDLPEPHVLQAWQQHSQHWLGVEQFTGHHFYFTDPAILTLLLERIDHHLQRLIAVQEEVAS